MADAIRGGIIINEILANPGGSGVGFDTDGNGTISQRDEFIELLNVATSPIDISGLQLWDPGIGNWFTFPPGTVLEPGGYAVVLTGVQSGGRSPPPHPEASYSTPASPARSRPTPAIA